MECNILDEWKVNSSLATPLAKQLADNIRWSISIGKVKPGEKLLPLRDLAHALNLSINTARIAYKMLEDQQLVITRPHHGTHVIDFPNKLSNDVDHGNDSSRILAKAVGTLMHNGMTLSAVRELFDAVCEQISKNQSKVRVLFVECSEFECEELGGQIARELNIHVDHVLLDQLAKAIAQESIQLETYAAVITTYFHYSTVRQSIRPHETPVLGMVVEMPIETERRIAAMTAGQKAGIICQPEHSLQYLINLIKSKRNDIEILTAFSNAGLEKIAELMHNVDAVFVTPSVPLDLKSIDASKPAYWFVDHINSQSIDMLRQFLQSEL